MLELRRQNISPDRDWETILKKEVKEIKDVLQEILNEVKKDEKKKTNVKRSADSNRKSNSTDDESGGKDTESK